ncbi:uncharacterized protein A1O5_09025 [Cladophialophora psammophila CBS 110553]|uniref:Uncharacterized protein n=1 Tax=Cladophialophora psammophila CBS 110553 TaxID=1182543 RepID=W9XB67_9EURO|nr:uncharacterized protein A1O5_09025 [Cladophialophora psammophila CBS 110553]EXJ67679.1 hypothetical protein A1O5_09025 [Cladophialophora psammophila CBS 110553]
MGVEDDTGSLLSALTAALQSAAWAFPETEQQLLPPAEGISLLDTKNDLLLSYIQSLAILVVIKLRSGYAEEPSTDLVSEVVKHLVDLRVYLERGVRPLESKLKYQIDKVVRAAEEAERRAARRTAVDQGAKKQPASKTPQGNVNLSNEFESGSEESAEDDVLENSYTEGDMSVGPRPAALLRNMAAQKKEDRSVKPRSAPNGAYKPPRITPTAMPEPVSHRDRDPPTRKRRSQLLDEYIDEEFSTAPLAQPSIGSNSTIVKHGRGAMSAKEREKERERTEYEERNFVRLPAESKAERRKARLRGEMDKRDLFGGEDWTGLGGLGDRIHRSVAGRARGEGSSVLERRQKRRRETQDGPRGDGGGMGIGESFEKKRRIMEQRADKKATRRR